MFPVRHSARELNHQLNYTMKHVISIPKVLGQSSVTYASCACSKSRQYHASSYRPSPGFDPRLEDHGRVIHDEYSVIREKYGKLHPTNIRNLLIRIEAPKYPVVLAHGLLGFDELRLAGRYLPGVQYWRGIKEALTARGIEVITATVPPSGSIEARAEELARDIEIGARGKDVNIIAYVKPFAS